MHNYSTYILTDNSYAQWIIFVTGIRKSLFCQNLKKTKRLRIKMMHFIRG